MKRCKKCEEFFHKPMRETLVFAMCYSCGAIHDIKNGKLVKTVKSSAVKQRVQ